jgi:hypothetical protein
VQDLATVNSLKEALEALAKAIAEDAVAYALTEAVLQPPIEYLQEVTDAR